MKSDTFSRREAIRLVGLGAAAVLGLEAIPMSALAATHGKPGLVRKLESGTGKGQTAIHGRWQELGGEDGYLGLPTSQVSTGDNRLFLCRFENGLISYDSSSAEPPVDTPDQVTKQRGIVTPSGTALGGQVHMTLKSNGDWAVQFHMHDSGAAGYDFTVHAFWNGGVTLAASHHGHVDGTTKVFGRKRDSDSNQSGNNQAIRHNWKQVKTGDLAVAKDYSTTGVVGALEDVAKIALDIGAGAAGESLGVVIGLGEGYNGIFAELKVHLKIGGTMGVIAGAVVCAFSGGFVVASLAQAAGTVLTNALVHSRALTPAEFAYCDRVFMGTLPSEIRITNLHSVKNRAFTFKGMDNVTYLNLGPGFFDPTKYTHGSYHAPGQLLIHELTHAWQIEHNPDFWIPGLICEGLINQANNSLVTNVYVYGPPTLPWSKFNLEAQAAIVDQWFGGNPVTAAPNRKFNSDGSKLDTSDPYFHYIANNIRRGRER